NLTIVRYMAVCLNQTITSNHCTPFIFSSTVYGNALTNGRVVANFGCSFLPFKFQVLWNSGNNRSWENPTILANPSPVHNGNVGSNPSSFTDLYISLYSGKWIDGDICADFRIGMNIC